MAQRSSWRSRRGVAGVEQEVGSTVGTPSPRRIPCAYMYDTPHGQPGWLMREAPSGDARVLGFIAQHGQLTLAQMLRQRPVDGFHELLVTMQDGDTSKPGAVYLHRDDPGRLIHVSPRRSPGPTTQRCVQA